MEGTVLPNHRSQSTDNIGEIAVNQQNASERRNRKFLRNVSRQSMLKRRHAQESGLEGAQTGTAMTSQHRPHQSTAGTCHSSHGRRDSQTGGQIQTPSRRRSSLGLIRTQSLLTSGPAKSAGDSIIQDKRPSDGEIMIEKTIIDTESLMRKFRFWSRFVVAISKIHREIHYRFGNSNFGDQMEVIDNTENIKKQHNDLHFNPSYYKANKQMRMSQEAKRILNKRPEYRTEAEIQHVMIALRSVDLIADYPLRMQRNLATHGTFECYEPKRAIVRQGHPAQAFYFILYGTVIVAILAPGEDQAKTVCYLHRGDSFGELALINRDKRAATVISKNEVELLSISAETYASIFMVGGARNIHDPDHSDFMESLWFLDGWPKHLLVSDPKIFVFSYFTRNAVMVKDSNYSDWIYIVKSGSVRVLKKLVKVKSTVSERTGRTINLPSKSQKLDAFKTNQLSLLSRASDHSPERIRDFPDSAEDKENHSQNEKDIEDNDTSGLDNNLPSYVLKSRRIQSAVHNMSKNRKGLLLTGRNIHSARGRSRRAPSPRKIEVQEKKTDDKDDQEQDEEDDPNFVNQRRTYLDDLDAGYKAREHIITEADRNPVFVHIQTLIKGQTMGLVHEVLKPQPSLCLVSNGAECIMINKRFYFEHCSQALMRKLRQQLSPFPADEELQSNLLTRINWDTYKQATHQKLREDFSSRRTQPTLNGH